MFSNETIALVVIGLFCLVGMLLVIREGRRF